MRRFVVRVIGNAIALWLETLVFAAVGASAALHVSPYRSDPISIVLTYLLLGLLFGVVNGVLGQAIRVVAFPLYLLTLGLFALIAEGIASAGSLNIRNSSSSSDSNFMCPLSGDQPCYAIPHDQAARVADAAGAARRTGQR